MSDIKQKIVNDYSEIANYAQNEGHQKQRESICKPIYDEIAFNYPQYKGYLAAADLGLGCGFPFNYLHIKHGEVCADLGCASGVDTFILSNLVGNEGFVYGFDITNKLIERATGIALENDITNIQFVTADIEQLPLEDNTINAITSNGVFSLLPDKLRVFKEMYRVLKPGGRFCISDISQKGDFSRHFQDAIYEFTGCLNGISPAKSYIDKFIDSGFNEVNIVHERIVPIPESFILQQAALTEQPSLLNKETGLFIVTITGVKPLA